MSYTESKDYNEFNMNKLLSIRPKLKLNRSIYNNNNKIPTNSYTYKDDNSSEIDLLSEMTIESQSKKSSDDVSINNEFTMNTSIYKNQELKCISVISNSITSSMFLYYNKKNSTLQEPIILGRT